LVKNFFVINNFVQVFFGEKRIFLNVFNVVAIFAKINILT